MNQNNQLQSSTQGMVAPRSQQNKSMGIDSHASARSSSIDYFYKLNHLENSSTKEKIDFFQQTLGFNMEIRLFSISDSFFECSNKNWNTILKILEYEYVEELEEE